MPEPILGLPNDILRSDSRIMFLVGRNNLNQLALLNVDSAQDLVRAINGLASASSGGQGAEIFDTDTETITAAVTTVNFEIDTSKISGVKYINSGDFTIDLTIRFSTTADDTSSGSIPMGPGAQLTLPRHLGFSATSPTAAPTSFLTYIMYVTP